MSLGAGIVGIKKDDEVNFSITIRNCKNFGKILSQNSKGYIAGIISSDRLASDCIENCENYGNIYGYNLLGGIIVGNEGIVKDCINRGNINFSGFDVGGICAWNQGFGNGKIINCVNYGKIQINADGDSFSRD